MKSLFFKCVAVAMLIASMATDTSAQPRRSGAAGAQRGVERVQRAKEKPEAKSVEEMADGLTKRMTEKLDLTSAQAKKVATANLDMITKMKANRERNLAKEYKEAVVAILTPAQIVEYMKVEQPRGRRPQPKCRPEAQSGVKQGDQRPASRQAMSVEEIAKKKCDKAVKSLALSDEQAAQLYEVELEFIELKKEVRETPIRYKESIVALLKPDQIVKFMSGPQKGCPQRGVGPKMAQRGPQKRGRGPQRGMQKMQPAKMMKK